MSNKIKCSSQIERATVRIAKDVRDASKDYLVTKEKAKKLITQNKIAFSADILPATHIELKGR